MNWEHKKIGLPRKSKKKSQAWQSFSNRKADIAMTLSEAKLVLKIDTDYEDDFIQSLVNAIPQYIFDCTGLTPDKQAEDPLCNVLAKFLIVKWHERDETCDKTIESLIKTLKVKTQAAYSEVTT